MSQLYLPFRTDIQRKTITAGTDALTKEIAAQRERLGIDKESDIGNLTRRHQANHAQELLELKKQEKLQRLCTIVLKQQKQALRILEDLTQPPNYQNRIVMELDLEKPKDNLSQQKDTLSRFKSKGEKSDRPPRSKFDDWQQQMTDSLASNLGPAIKEENS